MIKKIFVLVLGLIAFNATYAQDNLHLYLKDGSVLNGYISRQKPGEDVTFTTNSAVIILDNDSKAGNSLSQFRDKGVQSIIDNQVKGKDLSEQWKEWASKNDAYVGNGDEAYIILSDIMFTDGSSIHGVRILERGAKVKFLEFTPNNKYSFPIDVIEVIKADRRPKLQLSGVNRKYKVRSGMEYEGQYVEEVPGVTVSLYQDNGVIQVVNSEEIVKDNRYKVNPDQSLVEQSDLLDVVQLNNGTSYSGVIFERNYSETDNSANDYLLIQTENGDTRSVILSDVAEYRKEKNPKYSPLIDVEINEGEFLVNRILTKAQTINEDNNLISVAIDSIKTELKISDSKEITIETKQNTTLSQQYSLVKVNKYYDKRNKENVYGFTYENVVKSAIQAKKVETSVNGITRMLFDMPQKGIYALYNSSKKEIIPFIIK